MGQMQMRRGDSRLREGTALGIFGVFAEIAAFAGIEAFAIFRAGIGVGPSAFLVVLVYQIIVLTFAVSLRLYQL